MSKPNYKQCLLELLTGLGCDNIDVFMAKASPEDAVGLGKYIASVITALKNEVRHLEGKLSADRTD